MKNINQIPAEAINNAVAKGLDAALETIGIRGNVTEGFYGMTSDPGAAISSENREKLGKVYEWLKSELEGQGFNIIFNRNHIIVKILYPGDVEGVGNQAPGNLYESEDDTRKEEFDYLPYISEYIKFLKETKGLQVEPLPEIVLNKNDQSKLGILAKTGNYQPSDIVDPDKGTQGILTIYVKGRHPKDCCRSFSHEMVHHMQALQGKNLKTPTTVLGEDQNLDQLEREAYEKGNMYFREWTESLEKSF